MEDWRLTDVAAYGGCTNGDRRGMQHWGIELGDAALGDAALGQRMAASPRQHGAMGGHSDVLKWAREQHCSWNEGTCTWAVEDGHLDVLRWAREHGCPWTAETRDLAATKGYSDNLPLSV